MRIECPISSVDDFAAGISFLLGVVTLYFFKLLDSVISRFHKNGIVALGNDNTKLIY